MMMMTGDGNLYSWPNLNWVASHVLWAPPLHLRDQAIKRMDILDPLSQNNKLVFASMVSWLGNMFIHQVMTPPEIRGAYNIICQTLSGVTAGHHIIPLSYIFINSPYHFQINCPPSVGRRRSRVESTHWPPSGHARVKCPCTNSKESRKAERLIVSKHATESCFTLIVVVLVTLFKSWSDTTGRLHLTGIDLFSTSSCHMAPIRIMEVHKRILG